MPKRPKPLQRAAAGEVIINIPRVRPDSRLADLTVEQFTQLLYAVITQARQQRAGDPRRVKAVVAQIRNMINTASGKAGQEFSKDVLDAQKAILEKMPDFVRAAHSIRGPRRERRAR